MLKEDFPVTASAWRLLNTMPTPPLISALTIKIHPMLPWLDPGQLTRDAFTIGTSLNLDPLSTEKPAGCVEDTLATEELKYAWNTHLLTPARALAGWPCEWQSCGPQTLALEATYLKATKSVATLKTRDIAESFSKNQVVLAFSSCQVHGKLFASHPLCFQAADCLACCRQRDL